MLQDERSDILLIMFSLFYRQLRNIQGYTAQVFHPRITTNSPVTPTMEFGP